MIETGELDREQFRRIGFAALSGGAEGFLRGSVSAALTIACKTGACGEALKSISPTVIGAITVITFDTMKNAFEVSIGKKDQRELVDDLVKEMYISACSLLLGGAVQSIMVNLPVVGFMMGSFVGSLVGSYTYTYGYNAVLSFCVDTGFTMFGLVDQDYTLPEDVLKQIGLNVFEYEHFEIPAFEIPQFELETFTTSAPMEIYFLRRGVIGIRQIGYV